MINACRFYHVFLVKTAITFTVRGLPPFWRGSAYLCKQIGLRIMLPYILAIK